MPRRGLGGLGRGTSTDVGRNALRAGKRHGNIVGGPFISWVDPFSPMRHPLLLLLTLLALPAPAAGRITFQSPQGIDLGGEATAAVFVGGDPRHPLVATPDGLATLRVAGGEVVRGERSRLGGGARVLAADANLVVFASRDTARLALASTAIGAVPATAEEVDLPAPPRAARLLPMAGGTTAVAVLHDAGLSIVTQAAGGWQRREVAAPRFAADLAVLDGATPDRATVVLADQTSSALFLLRSHGDGTFDVGGTVATARGPRRLVIADVDGDRRSDLLVVAEDGLYLHGVGRAAALAPARELWRSPHVADVGVADLSGDHRPDLVVADRSAGTAVVLLADGVGGFRSGGGYMVGAAPENLLAGDVDGDGAADVIVFDHLGGGATWLRGRGDGSLDGVPCTLGSFGTLTAMVSEDFDGDEHPDLAALSEENGELGIFLGVGDGRFRPLPPLALGRRPRALAVGDFNLDEKPDLAVAIFSSDAVVVLLGDGSGHFAPARHVKVGGGPTALSVGSFASPTSVDLAVVNSLSDDVSILYGDGHGDFPTAVTHAVPARPSFLIVGDTNQDGNQDLVVGSAYSQTVAILLGSGRALDPPTSTILAGTAQPSLAEDFDHDGQMDLVNPDAFGGAIEILPGERPGQFGRAIRLAVGRAPQALATGDFDRDGRVDIAVADRNGQTIAILLNSSPRPQPLRAPDRHDVRQARRAEPSGLAEASHRVRN